MGLLAHATLLGLYKQCGFEFLGPSRVEHGSELWFDMQLDLVARCHLDLIQVDAFSSVPFAGNPAAVLFTHRGGDEAWMQAVAVENNLSETAFLERSGAEGEVRCVTFVGLRLEAKWRSVVMQRLPLRMHSGTPAVRNEATQSSFELDRLANCSASSSPIT